MSYCQNCANLEAELASARHERDETVRRITELGVRRIDATDGLHMELAIARELAGLFASMADTLLDETSDEPVENYLEIRFAPPHDPLRAIVMTIQRPGRPTPHELRRQAEAERDELRAKLSELSPA